LTQIVQLDLDLKYKTNIRDLFQEFDKFPPGAVIGITREMQPVYRGTNFQALCSSADFFPSLSKISNQTLQVRSDCLTVSTQVQHQNRTSQSTCSFLCVCWGVKVHDAVSGAIFYAAAACRDKHRQTVSSGVFWTMRG
ncbi:hypothetical protein AMECASPLE_033050, partial [Ameca splendens]